MKIWVYTLCWNEAAILPYFLRHYALWACADKIIVYDNESTDNSRQLCEAYLDVEVRTYQSGNTHAEADVMTQLRNTCWHEARGKADWVLIVDVDELVYHFDFNRFLDSCTSRGITLVRAYGFDMVSAGFPQDDGVSQLWELVPTGVQSGVYSKPCLFRPEQIEEMRYAYGAHDCIATGNVNYLGSGALKLLHFKHLGWDYYWDRVEQLKARSAEVDLQMGHFGHYRVPKEVQYQNFKRMLHSAVDLTT